ncbi:MAG: hypothetical protein IPK34_00375 [Ramlibacter sp.]|nr:hypothetical protein [Ramlibacter sp.]
MLAATLIAAAMPALADLIPPGQMQAQLRFNSGAWDREDQFCAGKREKDTCQIPGNPFEGGGAGRCVREIPRGASQIDMVCRLDAPARVRRDIPEGGFVPDSTDLRHGRARGQGGLPPDTTCTPPAAPLADRFAPRCAKATPARPKPRWATPRPPHLPGAACGSSTRAATTAWAGASPPARCCSATPASPAPARVFGPRARPVSPQGDASR